MSRTVSRRQRDTELRLITAAIEGVLQADEHPAVELLALIAAGVRNPVVITDATLSDQPTIYGSPAFYALTGYTAAEVLGRNLRLLQGQHTSQAAVERIRDALARGEGLTLDILNY